MAEQGRGTTSPNPLVGCVVVAGDRIVGRGHHERAGGPHAEIVALQEAGERARDAHVAVTLEPCNHEGRTPPCTDALIAAGVRSVAIGMRDPNPGVEGGGTQTLRMAGILVSHAEDPAPFEEQNEAWLSWLRSGMPWVRVKVALTLDGRPALTEGERAQLTGEETVRLTARLRGMADAVAVGARTVAVDDPQLTVRDEQGRPLPRQPARIVLARDTVPDARRTLFTGEGGSVIVVLGDDVSLEQVTDLHDAGADVLSYPRQQGLSGALQTLAREGVVHLLVEPGPTLFTALWDAGLIDELIVYHAGGVGGSGAPALYPERAGSPLAELDTRFRAVETSVVGDDVVSVWRPTSPPAK